MKLSQGDTLFLYTDGLSESRDPSGAEYGLARLAQFVGGQHALAPETLTAACLKDARSFSSGALKTDDLTIMVIRRAP